MSMRVPLFLLLMVLGTSGGGICITYGMKTVGGPEHLRFNTWFKFLLRALTHVWFWIGLCLMAMAFYALLVLLSWEPISLVVPASALNYVLGTLGSKYILREDVTRARWAGVVLVCAGVAIVALG